MESSLWRRYFALLGYAFIQYGAYLITHLCVQTPPLLAWTSLIHGLIASIASWLLLSAPWWWCVLQLILPILGSWLLSHTIPTHYYLAVFLILCAFFGTGSLRRAPLFLSGQAAWDTVATLIGTRTKLLDAGCGQGGLLFHLAQSHPHLFLTGAELAWMPLLICHIRKRLFLKPSEQSRLSILHKNFWSLNWEQYDIIFVFLSPTPMPKVWEKFQAECTSGTRLISYHFLVPDHPPTEHLMDAHGRSVYMWEHA